MELDYAFPDPYADSRVSGTDIRSDYGYGDYCCPLVVDTICVAAIVFSIAGASLLLARVIQIEINPPRRRKRSLLFGSHKEGKHSVYVRYPARDETNLVRKCLTLLWLLECTMHGSRILRGAPC